MCMLKFLGIKMCCTHVHESINIRHFQLFLIKEHLALKKMNVNKKPLNIIPIIKSMYLYHKTNEIHATRNPIT